MPQLLLLQFRILTLTQELRIMGANACPVPGAEENKPVCPKETVSEAGEQQQKNSLVQGGDPKMKCRTPAREIQLSGT